jgi:hypothetical protein
MARYEVDTGENFKIIRKRRLKVAWQYTMMGTHTNNYKRVIMLNVMLLFISINVFYGQPPAENASRHSKYDYGVLQYPRDAGTYGEHALSFDSLFELTEHAPRMHYYREGDEQLSSVHELINNAPDGSVIEVPVGEYTSQYFVMENRHDLTLKAKPGTVWLISDDALSTIFYIVNCTNITIQGIGFLHRTGGFCTGNSIEIHGSSNIILDSCDISGSGTIGVVADYVDSLIIRNSYVHHCTYQIMSLEDVRNVTIFNNHFTDNIENLTITEGISFGSIWGTCVVQNNTFYRNRCAALVFEIWKQEKTQYPCGDGHVYVRRNLFYDNYSTPKSASIYDVYFDDSWGEYSVNAKHIVSFRENIFNTYSDIPLGDKYVDHSGQEYYIYPELIIGEFDLKDNYFRDVRRDGYSVETDSCLIGSAESTFHWLSLSRAPEEENY